MKKALIIIAAVVAVVVLVGFFLPKKLMFEREIEINASPELVYKHLINFKEFNKWSPWFALDPKAEYKYEGAETGVGSKMIWKSNHENVGNGSQEIIAAEANSSIRIQMIFGEMPPAYANWKLTATEKGTKASWGFESDLDFIGGYMSSLIESMVGEDYDKGLKSLKELCEKAAQVPKLDITAENVVAQDAIAISDSSTTKSEEITAAFQKAFGSLSEFMGKNKLEFIAPPLSIADEWNEKENRYKFTAAIPVANTKAKVSGNLKYIKTYSGKAMKAIHKGAYKDMAATYMALEAYFKENNIQMAGSPWEVYISDPTKTPEAELITWIYYPVK